MITGACIVCAWLPVATFSEALAAEAIETVVVTARRITENLQDVPMSVQVLSGDFLDQANLTRLYELQFSTPGLLVNNSGLFGARFSLRGISDQEGSGVSVASHLNGIYLGDANLAIVRMFDLERIEVLKGPQGTLYGRNATGGSINFITRTPQEHSGAEVEAAYGSHATTRAQGHVDIVRESAGLRLAFIASEGDGYIRNSVDDRRFAENDFWGLRTSLSADMSDRVRVSLMAQRVRDDGASGDLWTPNPAYLVDPSDIRLTTVTLNNPYLVTENDNVSLTLDYDIPIGTLRSLTGYARSRTENLDDCAGTPTLQGCVRGGTLGYEQWSQEFQLVLHGTGSLDGLLGLYYFGADGVDDFDQYLPLVFRNPLNDTSRTSETAAAVYGQASLRLADRWISTAGLRLSREEHRLSTTSTGYPVGPTQVTGSQDSDDLSWRLDLQYVASEDVRMYGSVSTGFKSGGLVAAPVRSELDDFGAEHVVAYEAGAKSRWLDGRVTLNAAAFYYDVADLQVRTVTLAGGVDVANAARAELYGVDAEGVFVISDRWKVSGGGVWMPQRKFVRFEGDQSGATYSGNELALAPEWSANAAVSYEQSLPRLGRLSTCLEYGYRSGYFFTKENDPAYAQDAFGLLSLLLRLDSENSRWYAFASGRNLTSEDYFHQVFFQSSPGYPDTYEIGAGLRF
jgi:iron complex outermembrane receptor protein